MFQVVESKTAVVGLLGLRTYSSATAKASSFGFRIWVQGEFRVYCFGFKCDFDVMVWGLGCGIVKTGMLLRTRKHSRVWKLLIKRGLISWMP